MRALLLLLPAMVYSQGRHELTIKQNQIYRIVLANQYFRYNQFESGKLPRFRPYRNHTLYFENQNQEVLNISFVMEQGYPFSIMLKYPPITLPRAGQGPFPHLFFFDENVKVFVYYFAFVKEGLAMKFEYLPPGIKNTHTVAGPINYRFKNDDILKMRFENHEAVVSGTYLSQDRIRDFLTTGKYTGEL